MQALIVLGIIPGTNIQIGFFGWLAVFAALIGARFMVRRLRKKQSIRFLRSYASLLLANRQGSRTQIHIS